MHRFSHMWLFRRALSLLYPILQKPDLRQPGLRAGRCSGRSRGGHGKSQACQIGIIGSTCPPGCEPHPAAGAGVGGRCARMKEYFVSGARPGTALQGFRWLRQEMDGIPATFGWGRGALWLLSWSLLPPSGHAEPTTSCWSLWAWPGIADPPTTVSAPGSHQAVSCVCTRLPGHIQS